MNLKIFWWLSSCHLINKESIKNYSEITSIVSEKSNQNDNSMKAIKIKQNGLDEIISTENSNTKHKNKGMNL